MHFLGKLIQDWGFYATIAFRIVLWDILGQYYFSLSALLTLIYHKRFLRIAGDMEEYLYLCLRMTNLTIIEHEKTLHLNLCSLYASR